MLLKAGAAILLVSLVLSTGVAAVFALRGKDPENVTVSAASRGAVEKVDEKKKFDPGHKLEIEDSSDKDEIVGESGRTSKGDESGKGLIQEQAADQQPIARSQLESAPAPESVPKWPQPTDEQLATADAPRYYQLAPDTSMTLTVEAIGLHDVPVISSADLGVLDRGIMHEPETSLPWDGGAQRNVFLAGHYLGWPGTASHLVFYNLDKLKRGDEVVLKDSRRGRAHRYRVSEAFEATPEDSWVMGQVRNRDLLTLQTCMPPTFEERLVVRADRA